MLSTLSRFRRERLALVLFTLFAVKTFGVIVWSLNLIPVWIDISFPEGAIVARAMAVANGAPAYQDWRLWPHHFAPYGPLTYYPVGWASRLLGGGADPMMTYMLGRILSLAGLGGIALAVALMIRRLGGSMAWGAVGACIFPAWDRLIDFTISYRPDAPQVCIALFALLLVLEERPSERRIWIAWCLLSLSMWFKPMGWSIGLILAATSVGSLGWRRAMILLGVFVGVNLAGAALLNHAMNGRLFLNMIGSLDNGWSFVNISLFYGHVETLPGLIYMLGMCYSAHGLVRRELTTTQRRFHQAVAVSALLAAIQVSKVGADINYMLESYALASASVVLMVRGLWLEPQGKARLWVEALNFLIIIPTLLYHCYAGLRVLPAEISKMHECWTPTHVARRLGSQEGPFLTLNPFLSLLHPRNPGILDHVQYGILRERGRLSDRGLIERIEAQTFRLIVLPIGEGDFEADKWLSPRFRDSVSGYYLHTENSQNMMIFRPADGP